MPPSSQVKLNFDKLDEKGLEPVLKKFAKGGYKIASVEANNRAKRESGFAIKNFTLTFEDGQKMLVRVKGDGTVFQVKLNNRVVPIKHVDDMDKAITEMCNYLYDNAKSYSQAKKQRERQKKIGVERPKATLTREERIAGYREKLTNLTDAETDIRSQIESLRRDHEGKDRQLDRAKSDLDAEYKRTDTLNAEIDRVKAEIAATSEEAA